MVKFYFPCNRLGRCLNGYCPTTGSLESLIKDLHTWIVFDKAIKFVSIDGEVTSIKALI